jgi:hypothetical protein
MWLNKQPFSFLSIFVLKLEDNSARIVSVLIFKLEEEESPTLLLHLPKLFAETTVFGSGSGISWLLVVGFAQAAVAI